MHFAHYCHNRVILWSTRESQSQFIFLILFSSIAGRSLATLILYRTALLPLYSIDSIIHYDIHLLSHVNQKHGIVVGKKRRGRRRRISSMINAITLSLYLCFLINGTGIFFIRFFLFLLIPQ